jgi:hypothetical protein
VWKQYQAEGILTLKQEVVDYATVVVRSDENFLKGMALYIPFVVFSVVMNQYTGWSPHIVTGVTVIGASILYVLAARHHMIWGKQDEDPKPVPQTEPLPNVTEVHEVHNHNARSLFRFSKDAVSYPSGEPVQDHMLWAMAVAWKRGTPFSKQLYLGESKVATRPAFEALRDAFVRARIAYQDGQDIALTARGQNVLRQWARQDCPPIVMDRTQTGTVVRKSTTTA